MDEQLEPAVPVVAEEEDTDVALVPELSEDEIIEKEEAEESGETV